MNEVTTKLMTTKESNLYRCSTGLTTVFKMA